MPPRTIYLNKNAEADFNAVFAYLKRRGDIPANADDPGPYRAQVIAYALQRALDGFQRDERKQDA